MLRGASPRGRCCRCRQRHVVCRKQGLLQFSAVIRVDLGDPTSLAQLCKAAHGCTHTPKKLRETGKPKERDKWISSMIATHFEQKREFTSADFELEGATFFALYFLGWKPFQFICKVIAY